MKAKSVLRGVDIHQVIDGFLYIGSMRGVDNKEALETLGLYLFIEKERENRFRCTNRRN